MLTRVNEGVVDGDNLDVLAVQDWSMHKATDTAISFKLWIVMPLIIGGPSWRFHDIFRIENLLVITWLRMNNSRILTIDANFDLPGSIARDNSLARSAHGLRNCVHSGDLHFWQLDLSNWSTLNTLGRKEDSLGFSTQCVELSPTSTKCRTKWLPTESNTATRKGVSLAYMGSFLGCFEGTGGKYRKRTDEVGGRLQSSKHA